MQTVEPAKTATAIQAKATQEAPFFAPAGRQTAGGKAFWGGSDAGSNGFFRPGAQPAVQAKLSIGAPGDKYEQEADRMAERVVSQPAVQRQELPEEEERINRKPLAAEITPLVQRQAEEEKEPEALQRKALNEEPEEDLQRQTKEPEEEPPVQAKTEHGLTAAPANLQSRLDTTKGSGNPLPADIRSQMENAFGADFGSVRVHTGSDAAGLSKDLNAQAFTHGRDIYFNEGKYRPETTGGRRLLGHELVHVVQQNSTRLKRVQRIPNKSGIKNNDFSYSTNCGWIDWGHSNPELARKLIALIREASKRMERKEEKIQGQINAEKEQLIVEEKCKSKYEKREQKSSHTEVPIIDQKIHSSKMIEVWLGGFGVNSSEENRFENPINTLVILLTSKSFPSINNYNIEISGFTDCIGERKNNKRLRNARSAGISALLIKSLASRKITNVNIRIKNYDANYFLSSNVSKIGRKKNRGVLLRFIPIIDPEVITTPKMKSGIRGLPPASAVTPTVEIKRSLSEEEVLRVALTIFCRQSFAFEILQKWSDFLKESHFSEEDLPSNIISFYRAARGYSSKEVKVLCQTWNNEDSLKKLEGYTFKKNYTFYPLNLPAGGKWPAEFETIQPMEKENPLFKIIGAELEILLSKLKIKF